MTHVTIRICAIELYQGPDTELQSPQGTMRLTAGNYIVTDQHGGRWVFTLAQLQELRTRPELN